MGGQRVGVRFLKGAPCVYLVVDSFGLCKCTIVVRKSVTNTLL